MPKLTSLLVAKLSAMNFCMDMVDVGPKHACGLRVAEFVLKLSLHLMTITTYCGNFLESVLAPYMDGKQVAFPTYVLRGCNSSEGHCHKARGTPAQRQSEYLATAWINVLQSGTLIIFPLFESNIGRYQLPTC